MWDTILPALGRLGALAAWMRDRIVERDPKAAVGVKANGQRWRTKDIDNDWKMAVIDPDDNRSTR